jgi:hypothetical protein
MDYARLWKVAESARCGKAVRVEEYSTNRFRSDLRAVDAWIRGVIHDAARDVERAAGKA